MSRITIALFITLLSLTTNLFALSPLVLTSTEKEYSLAGKIEYLTDSSRLLTLEEVLVEKDRFEQAVFSDKLSFGYDNATHWLRFYLKNSKPVESPIMITLAYPALDSVTFYAVDRKTGKVLETMETGDSLSFNQRKLKHHNFLFPLSLNGNQEVVIYLKANSSGPLVFPLKVSFQEQFFSFESEERFFFGFYYGIILVMICYNLSLFVILRERSYLYFILYYSTWGIIGVKEHGLLFQHIWPELPALNNLLTQPLMICLAVFEILFAQFFLNTKKYTPLLHKILCYLLFVSVFMNLLFMFLSETFIGWGIILIQIVMMTAMFFAAIICFRKGYRPARYFLIAWSTIIFGFVIFLLTRHGLIPNSLLTEYARQIGTAIEMLFLSLGLVDKVNVIKQEKKEAQALVIKTQQQAQKKLIEKNRVIEKQNEEQKALTKLKNDFLANTSHELRTPLNGIIGLTQSLIENKKGALSFSITQDLKLIINSGKRLFLLVNDILDIVRLEQKDLKIDKKSLNLYEIVENCAKIQEPWFLEKRLNWVNRVSPDITVFADPDRLQQIILNLLSNALKFTFRGEISLSATVRERFVEVAIRDSGIGIDEKNLQRIFDRFEKENRDENTGGVGLGLSIVKSLVEKHGGEVHATSQMDVGSCFYFTIPVSNQPVEAIETSIPIASVHASPPVNSTVSSDAKKKLSGRVEAAGATYKVLIVDDDPVNLRSLINQLDIGEFVLQKATNGPEALNTIKQDKPDIVLMDIMMGRMSGIEACRLIRKEYGKLDLPIIFQTCRDRDIDLKKALEAGGNDYITKPFSSVEIASRIHNHLKISKECQQVPKQILEITAKIRDVVYIRSSHDYACLYGYDNRESIAECHVTLEKVMTWLGEELVKINRSTLVKASEIAFVQTRNRKNILRFKEEFIEPFECNLTRGNEEVFKERFPNLI